MKQALDSEGALGFGPRVLERLAIAAEVWDVAAGTVVGISAAIAIAAALGAGGRGARALVRSIVLVLPIGAWLLGSVSDAPLIVHSTVEWVDPWWRAAPITPVAFDAEWGSRRVPDERGALWLLGPNAEVVKTIGSVDGEATPVLQIIPDARAPLRRLIDQVAATGVSRVEIIGRRPRSVALDDAHVARERFVFVEAASREVHVIEMHVLTPGEMADRRAESYGTPPCWIAAPWEPEVACEPDAWRWLLLDEVPPDARAADLVRVQPEEIFVVRNTHPVRPSGGDAITPLAIPHGRSDLGKCMFAGAGLGLVLLAMIAGLRWRRRIPFAAVLVRKSRGVGSVVPRWLACSACDVTLAESTPAGYRVPDGHLAVVRTGRRFLPSVARTVFAFLTETRMGRLAAVALALALLRLWS